MAGRHRVPRQYHDDARGYRDAPPHPLSRTRAVSPRRLEEELSSRRAEMRRIREDNQRLADEIVGLRQTMPRLKEDLHASSQAVPKLRAEKELESRELTQRNLKLEAELRSLEPLRQDALHLRSEAGKLQSLRHELAAKVQDLVKELEHQKSESQKIPAMIAESDALRQELIQARAALEYEKNAKPELTAQVQAMEKDLVAMAQEAEMLRADIAKRRAPSFSSHGTYGAPLSTPGMGLQGMYDGGYTSMGSRYGTGPWDRMIPVVIHSRNWASDCVLPWTVPFIVQLGSEYRQSTVTKLRLVQSLLATQNYSSSGLSWYLPLVRKCNPVY